VQKGFEDSTDERDSAELKTHRAATLATLPMRIDSRARWGRVPHLNSPGGILTMIVTQQRAVLADSYNNSCPAAGIAETT
jgi:hypothetical protein